LFQFQMTGSDPTHYTVLVSTNFQGWNVLGPAVQTTNGLFPFVDPDASQAPQRFYRLRWH